MWVFPAGLVENGVYSENVAYFFDFFNSSQVLCHMPSPSVLLPFLFLCSMSGEGINRGRKWFKKVLDYPTNQAYPFNIRGLHSLVELWR